MTDTTATLSDQQLADNVRAAADALAAAWNAAGAAGLIVDVPFVEKWRDGADLPEIVPHPTVRRLGGEDL